MPRRRRPEPADPVDEAIRRAGSIGALERLAGIEQGHEARYAFWRSYSHLRPPALSLDAGVAEMKQRIRAQAAASAGSRRRRVS